MSHDFKLSTRTAVQMADLLRIFFNGNPDVQPKVVLNESLVDGIIPEQIILRNKSEEQPLLDEIRDTAGVLYDPAIHSAKRDGTPSIKPDGTFKMRRKIKAASLSGTDEQIQASIHTLNPDKNRSPVYVCRDANGDKFPGSTVATSREFATVLIEQLKAVRDGKICDKIISNNKDVLVRLREEGREELLAEIDAVTTDS